MADRPTAAGAAKAKLEVLEQGPGPWRQGLGILSLVFGSLDDRVQRSSQLCLWGTCDEFMRAENTRIRSGQELSGEVPLVDLELRDASGAVQADLPEISWLRFILLVRANSYQHLMTTPYRSSRSVYGAGRALLIGMDEWGGERIVVIEYGACGPMAICYQRTGRGAGEILVVSFGRDVEDFSEEARRLPAGFYDAFPLIPGVVVRKQQEDGSVTRYDGSPLRVRLECRFRPPADFVRKIEAYRAEVLAAGPLRRRKAGASIERLQQTLGKAELRTGVIDRMTDTFSALLFEELSPALHDPFLDRRECNVDNRTVEDEDIACSNGSMAGLRAALEALLLHVDYAGLDFMTAHDGQAPRLRGFRGVRRINEKLDQDLDKVADALLRQYWPQASRVADFTGNRKSKIYLGPGLVRINAAGETNAHDRLAAYEILLRNLKPLGFSADDLVALAQG